MPASGPERTLVSTGRECPVTEFLAANWLWIVAVIAMVAMHRRGGCGMHGAHHHHQDTDESQQDRTPAS